MARVTVEDCLQQVDNQYDLVILAKERTLQLGVGDAPQVPVDNDKRTVLALREIAEKKVSVKDLEESTIDRMRDHPDDAVEQEDFDSPMEILLKIYIKEKFQNQDKQYFLQKDLEKFQNQKLEGKMKPSRQMMMILMMI
jgi:DNA-directed RNA polymerase omega subunit